MANVQRITPEVRDIHVPAPLRDLPLFLCWRLEPRYDGDPKPLKVPYYPLGNKRAGRQGAPEDRSQLTTFAVARDQAAKRGMTGIGIALLEGYDLVAIDVDNCVTDGKLPSEILHAVGSTYAEYSPSGRGIRAIMRGNIGNHKAPTTDTDYGFEVFSTTGFCTLTGNALDHIDIFELEDVVAEVSPEIKAICERRFGSSTAKVSDTDDFMAGHEPKIGLSITQMEELLAVLDPDMPREDWIKVAMGLSHETDGDDSGFDIWNEWSAQGEKYPGEEELRKQWDSFDRRKGSGQRNITMATVMKMAKEAGYRDPRIDTSALQPADLPKVDAKPSHHLPEPFPGFMADVVDLALTTAHKRQPAMTLLGVLVAMASACGSKIYLPDGMRLNL